MGQQVGAALAESMHRVTVKLVSFLPGLLALLVAVVVLTAIGALVAVILRRILASARFDERFGKTQNATVADLAPSHSPPRFGRSSVWSATRSPPTTASSCTCPTPTSRRAPTWC